MTKVRGALIGLALFIGLALIMFAMMWLTSIAPWWPFALILAGCIWIGIESTKDDA